MPWTSVGMGFRPSPGSRGLLDEALLEADLTAGHPPVNQSSRGVLLDRPHPAALADVDVLVLSGADDDGGAVGGGAPRRRAERDRL